MGDEEKDYAEVCRDLADEADNALTKLCLLMQANGDVARAMEVDAAIGHVSSAVEEMQ